MRFETVKEKDLGALCRLYLQLVDDMDEQKMKKTFEEIKDDSHYKLFGVYNDAGELIATASLTKCFDLTEDARYYYSMENFVVDKNCRRQGAGTFLLKCLEDYVKENGGRYINFTSSAWRHSAHTFYESAGYPSDKVKGFKKEF